jgi:tungstate transport system permease protein
MELLVDGFAEAARLLFGFDSAVYAAAWRSLWISVTAVTIAALVGMPAGVFLARRRFPGQRLVVVAARTGMAVPTVFIGVVCFAMLSRRGPLGDLDLLFTSWGIVIGEILLALPIVITLTHGAVSALDPRVGETASILGAGTWQRFCTYLSEARIGVLLAVLTAFARCVTELGIAMMVGGNIRFRTRTLSTATALETGRGEFARGLAMGLVLVLVAVVVTSILVWMSREEEKA